MQKGANAIISEGSRLTKQIPIISVKNSKKSLIDLAKFARKRIKNLIVIAITGSTGKTTLKEWTFKILKNDYFTFCNYGNYNNDIGMPLTLCNMPLKSQICILEMGMNNRGEIKKLAEIAEPNVSIITNIGNAHVGNLVDRKGIAKEKSEIFSFLNQKISQLYLTTTLFFKFLRNKALKNSDFNFSFGKNKVVPSSTLKINIKIEILNLEF